MYEDDEAKLAKMMAEYEWLPVAPKQRATAFTVRRLGGTPEG
ncbi:MAG: hypothetical protein ACYC35_03280 [Pirellulales bacterium]